MNISSILNKSITRKKTGEAGLFLLVWIFIFELNYLFIGNYRVQVDLWFELGVWFIYVLIFFLNYYLLMPVLFFRRRVTVYILSSLLLLSGSFIVKQSLTNSHFEKMSMELSEGKESMPFPPGMPPLPEKGPPKDGRRILFVTYGILLSYLFSLSLRFLQKWQEDDKRKKEIENANISTELSFLKQQVNPHFLFNSLNSIYSLALSRSDITIDAILKLSSILRYMLYETDKPTVLLADELTVINDYIELQRLRLTEKVRLEYLQEGDPGQIRLAPFIILPLVENAFKYGTDTTRDSFINISILISLAGMHLEITNSIVCNPGDGNGSGIGLKNIKRRLDLLYPAEHRLEISEKDEIFSVKLDLALR
ncbi:MAG: histidine kinase [Bacteroidales bacterium]